MSKSGLPLQDPEDLRGMKRERLDRIVAPHAYLTRRVPQQGVASPQLPSNFKNFWALYVPEEDGVLRRIYLESEVGELLRALDRCESASVLITTAPEEALEPYLKREKILGLGFWDRNWKPVSAQELQQLGQSAAPDDEASGLLADVEL